VHEPESCGAILAWGFVLCECEPKSQLRLGLAWAPTFTVLAGIGGGSTPAAIVSEAHGTMLPKESK
jgi:hypothetical protein